MFKHHPELAPEGVSLNSATCAVRGYGVSYDIHFSLDRQPDGMCTALVEFGSSESGGRAWYFAAETGDLRESDLPEPEPGLSARLIEGARAIIAATFGAPCPCGPGAHHPSCEHRKEASADDPAIAAAAREWRHAELTAELGGPVSTWTALDQRPLDQRAQKLGDELRDLIDASSTDGLRALVDADGVKP